MTKSNYPLFENIVIFSEHFLCHIIFKHNLWNFLLNFLIQTPIFKLSYFFQKVQFDDEILDDLPLDDAHFYDEEKEIEKAKRLGLIMQLPTGTYTQSDKRIE